MIFTRQRIDELGFKVNSLHSISMWEIHPRGSSFVMPKKGKSSKITDWRCNKK